MQTFSVIAQNHCGSSFCFHGVEIGVSGVELPIFHRLPSNYSKQDITFVPQTIVTQMVNHAFKAGFDHISILPEYFHA